MEGQKSHFCRFTVRELTCLLKREEDLADTVQMHKVGFDCELQISGEICRFCSCSCCNNKQSWEQWDLASGPVTKLCWADCMRIVFLIRRAPPQCPIASRSGPQLPL